MTRRVDIPLGQIVDMLEERLDRLVFEFWPGAETHGGVIYCNPKPGDLGSFQVYLLTKGKQTAGRWNRFSQKRGGNVLNLIAYGLSGETEHVPASYGPTILWAKQWLGLDRPETDAERRRREERFERRRRQNEAKRLRAVERTAEHVAEIRRGASPIDRAAGDGPVRRYLEIGRGFDIGAIAHWCAPLRFHPDLWNWEARGSWPAMVADVIDGETLRAGRAVHCTFLAADCAGKAPIGRKAKLMRGPTGGGFVPITLGESGLSFREAEEAGVLSDLLVCEGIETGHGLACGASEPRIWAALSLGNIGALAPLIARARSIASVVVALENDVSPDALRNRDAVLAALERTGKPVFTMRSHVGSDFADLYT